MGSYPRNQPVRSQPRQLSRGKWAVRSQPPQASRRKSAVRSQPLRSYRPNQLRKSRGQKHRQSHLHARSWPPKSLETSLRQLSLSSAKSRRRLSNGKGQNPLHVLPRKRNQNLRIGFTSSKQPTRLDTTKAKHRSKIAFEFRATETSAVLISRKSLQQLLRTVSNQRLSTITTTRQLHVMA